MSGDYSRKTFEPRENFSGVGMQQGRVQLDADWNEQSAIQDRRWRAETVDIIGRCGYPRATPDAFRITNAGGALEIGPGRMYVDGLLAENHGGTPLVFDATLAEETGTTPVAFLAQPYLPDVTDLLPEVGGPALAYLDVWYREVTYLEDPSLVEKAVGVDTTTRQQTVWQVKLLAGIGAASCGSDDADIPGWLDIITPSGGRLSSEPVGVPEPTDLCFIPAIGGYKGLENRLYRVEIHDGGAPGPASFKWSRYNATVATRVTAIPDLDTLRVERTGRDDLLRFNAGDWVEVTDDHRELAGLPGIIRRVDSVDDGTRTINLRDDLPAGEFATDAQGQTLPERHTRVRRWDQSGVVRDTDDNILVDLDDPASTGVIPVPPDGTSVVLEDGVQITFDSEPTGAPVRSGDYWCIAARVVDGSVDELDRAPPAGIHHHYCRLAIIEFDGEEFVGEPTDCRTPYPPESTGAACCTVVVAPGGDIQAAIDSLPAEGGCVCIKTGLHLVDAPLRIGGSNIVMHGESGGARIRRENGAAVLRIQSDAGAHVDGVSVERIRFEAGDRPEDDDVAIVFTDGCTNLSMRDCVVTADQFDFLVGIRVGGVIGGTFERCRIGPVGMGLFVDADSTELNVVGNRIFAEFIDGTDAGIIGVWMEDAFGPSRIERNEIQNFLSGIFINSNDITQTPSSGATGTVVIDNRIERSSTQATGDPDLRVFGIEAAPWQCLVSGNVLSYRSSAYGGIRVTGPESRVEGNRLTSAFIPGDAANNLIPIGIQVGFASEEGAAFGRDSAVRDNYLTGRQDAILLVQTRNATVSGNRIVGAELLPRFGIAAGDCDTSRIVNNRILNANRAVFLTDGIDNVVEGNYAHEGGIGVLASDQTGLSVRSNHVLGMSTSGVLIGNVLGTTQIVENRVRACGFVGIGDIGALGLAVINANGNVHIESCEVIDTGVSEDQLQVAQPALGISGSFVLECTVQGNQVGYTSLSSEARDPAAEDRALWLTGFLEAVVSDTFVLGYAAQVIDNKFTGPGFSALVEFQQQAVNDNIFRRFERVTFSNNHCWHLSAPNDDGATVTLRGRRAIVMGNHVKRVGAIASFNFNGMTGIYIGNDVEGAVTGFTDFPSPSANFNR
jgi:hypothetical protein